MTRQRETGGARAGRGGHGCARAPGRGSLNLAKAGGPEQATRGPRMSQAFNLHTGPA